MSISRVSLRGAVERNFRRAVGIAVFGMAMTRCGSQMRPPIEPQVEPPQVKPQQVEPQIIYVEGTKRITAEGRLVGCILAEDVTIKRIKYAKGTDLSLFDDIGNRVHKGTLAEDTIIDGIKYAKGTVVEFMSFMSRDAGVYKGTLAEDTKRGGIKFAKGTKLVLSGDGGASEGTLAEDITIEGIKFVKGTKIKREIEYKEHLVGDRKGEYYKYEYWVKEDQVKDE